MAATVTGKLVRDVRLNTDGVPSADGRLYLRGETVAVHRDHEDLVAVRPARPIRPARRDKQQIPPATTTE